MAPIYAARETNTIGVYSSDLAKKVPGAYSFESFEQIEVFLRQEVQEGDLILTMGAGNIDAVGRKIIAQKNNLNC